MTMITPQISRLNLNFTSNGIARQSVNRDFAQKLRYAAQQGLGAASNMAQSLAPMVPGSAVFSAMLDNANNNLGADGAPGGTANLGMRGNMSPFGNSSGGNFFGQIENMQQNMMSSNMQMLAIQRQVQQMSEQYMTLSNVMKTRHDAEKNAITNMR